MKPPALGESLYPRAAALRKYAHMVSSEKSSDFQAGAVAFAPVARSIKCLNFSAGKGRENEIEAAGLFVVCCLVAERQAWALCPSLLFLFTN
jgi:hypothetical protein